jgi:hypothetical protein
MHGQVDPVSFVVGGTSACYWQAHQHQAVSINATCGCGPIKAEYSVPKVGSQSSRISWSVSASSMPALRWFAQR